MAKPGRISKTKGVELVADWLHAGKTRKEIGQLLAKMGGVSESGVDKWIKAARPMIAERQERAETIRAEKDAEEIEAIAKDLGISRRTILAELKKVAYMDPRLLYNPDGTPKEIHELDDQTVGAIAGIEMLEEFDPVTKKKIGTTRKVKKEPKLTAIAEINKMMGYYPATIIKGKVGDPDGEEKKFTITLNLGL